MFYKVATNTELVNTEPLLLGDTGLGSREPGHNTVGNQPIHNIVLWVFLFKDTWFNI